MNHRKREPVAANPEAWSESSKRSDEYRNPPSEYEDITYACWRCSEKAVFTAEAQKQAFEVRKVYVWQRRILCPSCFATRQHLKEENETFRARWNAEPNAISADRPALERWQFVLRELPRFAAREDSATIAMLTRLLANEA
jgi:Probable zinc-ribbon domain